MKKSAYILFISIFILSVISIALAPHLSAAEGDVVSLPNPLGDRFNETDLIQVLVRSLQIALGAVDVFALFMFIIGGFELLMSGGNQTLVKKGKDTLLWATIGVVVITLSYSVLKFIFEGLTTVTGT